MKPVVWRLPVRSSRSLPSLVLRAGILCSLMASLLVLWNNLNQNDRRKKSERANDPMGHAAQLPSNPGRFGNSSLGLGWTDSTHKKYSAGFAPIAYSIFFGIGVTSGLSIAPLLISSLPLWVIMLYVAICAAALALGAGLLIADRVLSKQRSIQIDQLVNEMSYIKDGYLENRTLVD